MPQAGLLQRGDKVLRDILILPLNNGIASHQNKIGPMADLMLMRSKSFPQEAARSRTCNRVADLFRSNHPQARLDLSLAQPPIQDQAPLHQAAPFPPRALKLPP